MSTVIHLFLLGEFQILSGGMPITALDRRFQSLLAYLALHRTVPQTRRNLAFLFWPDSSEEQAHTNLRNLLHKLRREWPVSDHLLRIERQTLQWLPTVPWTLDVSTFEQALLEIEQATQARLPDKLQAALKNAIACYRGDLLPHWYEEWLQPEREHLRQRFLQALERLLVLQEEHRDYSAAIETTERLLRSDPLQETAYSHLMRLYAANGDRAAALRTYHACATILECELGVAPGAVTREIYTRLLQSEGRVSPPTIVTLVRLKGRVPLIGRTSEWTQLQAVWQRTLAGRPHMVLLIGEAGMGKTHLAEELQAWIQRQGIATASSCAYAAEGGLPYEPVVTWFRTDTLRKHLSQLADIWLAELTWLMPEPLPNRATPVPTGTLQEPWQRQRLFEALTRATLGTKLPLLLILDDLQWCDQDTLEWLHYLLRFDPAAPLLLIGTVRPEEAGPEHPLTNLLESLRRSEQVTELNLGPLDASETARLATLLAHRPLDPGWIETLYQETEGNPLFVVETVRLRNETLSAQTSPNADTAIPPTVQTIIARRLRSLSPSARDLASLAATIGRAFSFSVLAEACRSDEARLVLDLDELWQRRIIREQGEEAYHFSHEKLRKGALATLSKARQRLLHQQIARALAVVYAETLDQISGEIAFHYVRANLPQLAVSYLERAGDWAYQIFAHAEATRFYQELAGHLNQLKRYAERAQALEKGARSLGAQAHYQQALENLEQALAWYQATGNFEDQTRVVAKTGQLQASQGAVEEGITLITSWLTSHAADSLSAQSQGALTMTLVYLFINSGCYSEALSASRQTLAFAQQAHDERLIALAQWHMGSSLRLLNQPEEALPLLQAALLFAEKTEDLRTQCYVLFNFALVYEMQGILDKARHYTERALPLTEQWGDPMLRAMTLTAHGYYVFNLGEWQRSRQDYEQAVALYRQAEWPWGAPYALLNLSIQLFAEGQDDVGYALLQEGTELAERFQDRLALCMAAQILALNEILRGDPASARDRLELLFKRMGLEEQGAVSSLPYLAWAYLELGEDERAQQLVDQVLLRARDQELRLVLMNVLPVHAQLAARREEWEEAERALAEALQLARAVPLPSDEAQMLYVAGKLALQRGKPAQAHEQWEHALAICARLGERRYAAHIQRALAACPAVD